MTIPNTQYRIQNTKHKLRGQSLMEILVAVAVGTILIGGSVGLMTTALRGYQVFKRQLQANTLGRQGVEIVQALSRGSWHSIAGLFPGVHYKIALRGNSYTLQKGEEKVFDDNGLVGYWNFDEATSTIAYDNSGNTNNGTLLNGPTWQSSSNCVSGSCLSFDGNDDYVNCGNDASIPIGASSFTKEVWVYLPDKITSVNYRQDILGWGALSSNNSNILRTGDNDNEIINYFYGNDLVWTSTNLVNGWNQIVITYDGNIAKGYVNGNYEAQHTVGAVNVSQTNVYIGKDIGVDHYFSGLIDEVRIYNRALSADEIKQHYQAGLDKLGLVSYWAMDEGGGTTAYDSQETNNGTLLNGPTWQSSSNCVSGSCLSFDGNDDYVDCGNDESLNITNAITIEAWIYPEDDGINQDSPIVMKHDNGNGHPSNSGGYSLFKGWGLDMYFDISDGNGEYQWHFTNLPNYNQWYYVTVTYEKSGTSRVMKAWVDGNCIGSSLPDRDLISNNKDVYIGGLNANFDGLIDEVRIYNRALSADEIASHYEAGYTRYVVLNKVSRSSGNIETTYNSANDDPSTLKISSIVKYGRGLVANQRGGIQQLNAYLTRSEDNRTFAQTDWSGGSGQTGPVPNPNNKYDSASNIITTTDENVLESCEDTSESHWSGSEYDISRDSTFVKDGSYNVKLVENVNNTYDDFFLTFDGSIDMTDRYLNFWIEADKDVSYLCVDPRDSSGSRMNCWKGISLTANTPYLFSQDMNTNTYASDVKSIQFFTNASDQGVYPITFKIDKVFTSIPAGSLMLDDRSSDGILTSSILDTGVSGGAGFNSLLWQGSLGSGGSVKFQIAFSNSSSGPWTYYGPSSTSDYYQPNPGISVAFSTTGSASPQNYRYIRYKVYLSTTGTSPRVDDIIINWSP